MYASYCAECALSMRRKIKELSSVVFYYHGLFCHDYASIVIICMFFVVSVAGYSLYWSPPVPRPVEFISGHPNPIDSIEDPLWFSNDRHLGNVLQIAIKTTISPYNDSQLIPVDLFSESIKLAFQVHQILEMSELHQYCFRPQNMAFAAINRILMDKSGCLIFSPVSFWQGIRDRFLEDKDILKTIKIVSSEYKRQIAIKDVLFGYPISFNISPRVLSFMVTMVLENNSSVDSIHNVLANIERTFGGANSHQDQGNVSYLHTHFKQLNSWNKLLPLVLMYLVVFLYIFFSVRSITLIKGKLFLSFFSVGGVVVSLLTTLCLVSLMGIPTSLDGTDVFPYFVVVIGLENTVVVIKSVMSTPEHLDIKFRIAKGISKEGYYVVKNLVMEVSLSLLFILFSIFQDFCIIVVMALIVDYVIQIFYILTILSIDMRLTNLFEGHYLHQNTYPLRRSQSLSRMRRSSLSNDDSPTKSKHSLAHSKRVRLFNSWGNNRYFQRAMLICGTIWFLLILYNSDNIATIITDKNNLEINTDTDLEIGDNPIKELLDYRSFQSANFLRHKESHQSIFEQQTHLHWPKLFNQLNVSLYGKYLTFLPPMTLSRVFDADVVVNNRHSTINASMTSDTNYFSRTLRLYYRLKSLVASYLSLWFFIWISTVAAIYGLYRVFSARISPRSTPRIIKAKHVSFENDGDCSNVFMFNSCMSGIEHILWMENSVVIANLAGEVKLFDTRNGLLIHDFPRRRHELGLQTEESIFRLRRIIRRDENRLPICHLRYKQYPSEKRRNEIIFRINQAFDEIRNSSEKQNINENNYNGFNFNSYYRPLSESPPVDAESEKSVSLLSDYESISSATALTPSLTSVWCMNTYNNILILGTEKGTIDLWDLFTGRFITNSFIQHSAITCITVEGRTICVGTFSGSIQIFEISDTLSGNSIPFVRKHHRSYSDPLSNFESKILQRSNVTNSCPGPITFLIVSDLKLVACSRHPTFSTHDLVTGRLMFICEGHSQELSCVSSVPSHSSYLLTGSLDKSVRKWDLSSGKSIYSLTSHADAVCHLEVSDCHILALTFPNILYLWDAVESLLLRRIDLRGYCSERFLLINRAIFLSYFNTTLYFWASVDGELIYSKTFFKRKTFDELRFVKVVNVNQLLLSIGSNLIVYQIPDFILRT